MIEDCIKSRRQNIIKGFSKGKVFPLGTERIWEGETYKKVSMDKWEKVSTSNDNHEIKDIFNVTNDSTYLSKLESFLDSLNLDYGKSPSGLKQEYEELKWIRKQVNLIKEFGIEETDMMFSNINAVLSRTNKDNFQKLIEKIKKKDTESKEIKINNITYVNKSLLNFQKFKEHSEFVDKIFNSLEGFHKKALKGDLTVEFVKKEDSKSIGKYKTNKNIIQIRPDKIKGKESDYASLPYIIVHELGHRYLEKNKVNFDYDSSSWITTPYSKTDSWSGEEKFAELFALSHFNYKGNPFDNYKDKIEKFRNLLNN